MDNELIAKIKAAKTKEEVLAIARKELSLEDIAPVAGGTGRFKMTDEQTEHVVGGGHYVKDAMGQEIWITLLDSG